MFAIMWFSHSVKKKAVAAAGKKIDDNVEKEQKQ